MMQDGIPDFFVYGEPARSLEVGFMHIETVMERRFAHFGRVRPHKHPLMGQITYWFKGRGVYLIDDQTWSFSAPTVSFVPSGVVHGFEVDEQSDAIVVSISDDLLRAMAAGVDLPLHVPLMLMDSPSDPTWGRLDGLLALLMEEYRTPFVSDRVLVGLISVVLGLVARLGGAADAEMPSPTASFARALRAAIDEHYRENWSVSRYVEQLATTPHLLDKAAHALFGHSVKEAVLARRLLEAKRLLKFTIRPVEDIGREIGFVDPAYFSRFFRHRTGLSPTGWRRRHAMGPDR